MTIDTCPDSLPPPLRLSRRMALLGAASLLAPLAPRFAIAGDASTAMAPGARLQTGPIRLDSNENPYGPSPRAREAILASVGEAPRYGDAAIGELTAAIAAHQHIDPAQVVIGSGSGELLNMAAMLAAQPGPGGELIAAQPTFEQIVEFAAEVGVRTRWVPLDARHAHDLPAMRAAISPETRLVYVCNPNNPTGTAVTRDALSAFVRSVPDSVLVLIDEAYIDLADADGVTSVVDLASERHNLIVLRTFSKIHGLAGLRVGYGVATPELAARLRKKQLAFPNIAGLRAAHASLSDHRFLTETRAALLADRARIHATLEGLGRTHTRSQGNFVFFDTGQPLPRFQTAMLSQGIKVGRHFDKYDNWARVTVGVRTEVDRFLAALPVALRASA